MIKIIKFFIQFKKEKFYRLSGATFYDRFNTIYQFIKSFLDNKMSIFEEYGTFKMYQFLLNFICFSPTKQKSVTI